MTVTAQRGATLLGERELRRICEEAMRAADGDAVEALIVARTGSLTRYANAAIHQNVSSREAELRVRVVRGKRVATQATRRLDADGIAEAARGASELAKLVPEDPRFGGLPRPRPIPSVPSAFVEATAAATAEQRALAVKRLCDAAREKKLSAAGFVATNVQEIAVASTLGTWAYSPETTSEVQIAALGDAGSAFAQRVSLDFGTLDVDGAATEAIDKAVRAQQPRELAAGAREVILETYAVRDIVGLLGAQLTGLAVEEGRSFVAGRLGESVTGPDITIVDDPYDVAGMARAFDFEGQPSDRVALIQGGIARAVVYDSATAHRTGARNTGHAMFPNQFAPAAAMHLRLEPGTRSREELIGSVRSGVLVTRFWYTRWVHQLRTIVTGMTRDGTFAIENGEIAYPVRNFRFTQSYHEALAGTLGVGRDLSLQLPGEVFGVQAACLRIPALHLASFDFTGVTAH